jgi:hypothetical protein
VQYKASAMIPTIICLVALTVMMIIALIGAITLLIQARRNQSRMAAKLDDLERWRVHSGTKIALLEKEHEHIGARFVVVEKEQERSNTRIASLEKKHEHSRTQIALLEKDRQYSDARIASLEKGHEHSATRIARCEGKFKGSDPMREVTVQQFELSKANPLPSPKITAIAPAVEVIEAQGRAEQAKLITRTVVRVLAVCFFAGLAALGVPVDPHWSLGI